ncbi:MAG: efflux RND transporter periplasmic adaptor subunit [Blastocatellia bacterium]
MADQVKRFITAIKRRRTLLLIVIILASTAGGAIAIWGNRTEASDYTTAKVARGNVEVTVSATGTVQAVTTVQVGSQVSGALAWLGADFKSQVKRGQVIARLDPAVFEAQLQNQQAGLQNAQAGAQAAIAEINNQTENLAAAKANQKVTRVQRDDAGNVVKRYLTLKNVLSGRELELAQAEANAAEARNQQAAAQLEQAQSAVASSRAKLEGAKAVIAQARAQLKQAQVNLAHATITSPIDGVVISRNVDVGQTVAASLQAPTLFVIANDLTNMQVLASIDEADVGQIREGITASFTVDAYPGQTFSGQISQTRLNAQTLQNVVTYTTVIAASNPDMKLLPGMTANISIPVAQADNALMVPNAALRFRPKADQQNRRDGQIQSNQRPAAQSGSNAQSGNRDGQIWQGQTIWVFDANKKIEPRLVRTGITNGRVTAIMGGDLQEGEIVVVSQN